MKNLMRATMFSLVLVMLNVNAVVQASPQSSKEDVQKILENAAKAELDAIQAAAVSKVANENAIKLRAEANAVAPIDPQTKSALEEKAKAEAKMELDQKKADDKNQQEMLNKYFGMGIAANFDRGGAHRRVTNAKTIAGLVRVEEESRSQLGFVLEAHKFLGSPTPNKKVVMGPFVGLVVGSEGAIGMGILGLMVGVSRPDSAAHETLNVGLGFSITPRAQILGDGILEGKPLPNNETEVRYKKTSIYGLALTVSFGF